MNDGYGKIFNCIYDGTLVNCWQALVTFEQMLIMCTPDGILDMTPQAITNRTGIPLEIINTGIEFLEKEDDQSRTPAENGRRIIRLSQSRSWGWYIVNHELYKNFRTREDRREYMRKYMKNKRNSRKKS